MDKHRSGESYFTLLLFKCHLHEGARFWLGTAGHRSSQTQQLLSSVIECFGDGKLQPNTNPGSI